MTHSHSAAASTNLDHLTVGDYVKYGQPASFAIALLAWSADTFREGMEAAGSYQEILSAVRWGTDFILASATNIGDSCTYYAQVQHE